LTLIINFGLVYRLKLEVKLKQVIYNFYDQTITLLPILKFYVVVI